MSAYSHKGLCAIFIGNDRKILIDKLLLQFPTALFKENNAAITTEQLIAHTLQPYDQSTLSIDMRGTAFQLKVWQALINIRHGLTLSYSEIAKKIGFPTAVRAVANACAANNLAIIIPCHRVIKNDGKLAGYRWGIDIKKRLLQYESQQSLCNSLPTD